MEARENEMRKKVEKPKKYSIHKNVKLLLLLYIRRIGAVAHITVKYTHEPWTQTTSQNANNRNGWAAGVGNVK